MSILTVAEAANALRCDEADPRMLDLLPQIDGYIQAATGRDWALDLTVDVVAKAAARMLLVKWFEDPGMMAGSLDALDFGLQSTLVQLEAKAIRLAEEEVS